MSPASALILTASAPLFALLAAGRRSITVCALVFVANEIFYLSAWAPYSPHRMLLRAGIMIPSSELWAVGDCVAGLAIVMTLMDAGRMRLAVVFLNLYLGQIACYIAMQGKPPVDPNDALWSVLDYCFYAMISIFAALGGGGVVGLVVRVSTRRRRTVSRGLAYRATTRGEASDTDEIEGQRAHGAHPGRAPNVAKFLI